ncbi:amidase domain-containing protein [bacterium LRH843]|nr:amidase domain-containing protein [bacterium LRH843]
MKERIVRQLHEHIRERNDQVIELNATKLNVRGRVDERMAKLHRKRGAMIVRSYVEGDLVRMMRVGNREYADYLQRTEQLIQLKNSFYMEEKVEYRRAIFENGQVVEDREVNQPQDHVEIKEAIHLEEVDAVRHGDGLGYNRREAVRYAERWWNDHNPAYQKFTDNCTNFISQCLRAGGVPMTGYPNRGKGWWYQGGNWSLSWSVAHSFRWYLNGSPVGLHTEERQGASELEAGDIICYDFDGDGRWQHSTIVVAKDANNEPLVNAQTSNSRMRFWTYEDSTAWTPNIKYKFFHLK